MDEFLEECKKLIQLKYSVFKSDLKLIDSSNPGDKVMVASFCDSNNNLYKITEAGENTRFIIKYKLAEFYVYNKELDKFFDMKYSF